MASHDQLLILNPALTPKKMECIPNQCTIIRFPDEETIAERVRELPTGMLMAKQELESRMS